MTASCGEPVAVRQLGQWKRPALNAGCSRLSTHTRPSGRGNSGEWRGAAPVSAHAAALGTPRILAANAPETPHGQERTGSGIPPSLRLGTGATASSCAHGCGTGCARPERADRRTWSGSGCPAKSGGHSTASAAQSPPLIFSDIRLNSSGITLRGSSKLAWAGTTRRNGTSTTSCRSRPSNSTRQRIFVRRGRSPISGPFGLPITSERGRHEPTCSDRSVQVRS